MIENLFPLGITHYLVGGLIIGSGVTFLFLATGLVGGMSTFFSSAWSWVVSTPYFQQDRFTSSRDWRLFYALGLILGAAVWAMTIGSPFQTDVSAWQLALGGFIAGFGARLSNGCTSGHGICGLGSLQLPSLLAVIVFLTTGMITAMLVKWLGGV